MILECGAMDHLKFLIPPTKKRCIRKRKFSVYQRVTRENRLRESLGGWNEGVDGKLHSHIYFCYTHASVNFLGYNL